MRKIVNPFIHAAPEKYPCFGCSPHNSIGLRLSFYEEGDALYTEWIPEKNYEGYNGVVHGGIQALIQDEIASWFIYSQVGTAGVTKSMEVEYHHPLRNNGDKVLVKATLFGQKENEVTILTEIFQNEKLCSSAHVTYFTFPEKIAKGKFHYPGKEAFFEPINLLMNKRIDD